MSPLILSILFLGQAPAPPQSARPTAPAASKPLARPAVAPAPVVQAAPTATPAPVARPAEDPALQKTIQSRRAREAREAKARATRAARAKADAQAQREYQLKMAPIVAQQQREAAQYQLQAQQAAALQAMGAAAQQNAAINRQRYVLQSQQAGVPQMVYPDGSIGPYPYGVAAPYSPQYILPR